MTELFDFLKVVVDGDVEILFDLVLCPFLQEVVHQREPIVLQSRGPFCEKRHTFLCGVSDHAG